MLVYVSLCPLNELVDGIWVAAHEVVDVGRFDTTSDTCDRRQTGRGTLQEFGAIYEGIRWILFSNR
jgi:hypothetical protein